MKMKVSVLVNIILATVLLTSISFMTTTTSSSSNSGYDPWLDYDDDGDIDFDDVVPMAMSYGTSGNPTKNVNIVNWPVSRPVTVWFDYYLRGSAASFSYNASGFGHLHILMSASGWGPEAEEVEVNVYGILWNSAHTSYTPIRAYSVTLTPASSTRDITISVPGEEFRFSVYPSKLTTCYFYLSFYLTWA